MMTHEQYARLLAALAQAEESRAALDALVAEIAGGSPTRQPTRKIHRGRRKVVREGERKTYWRKVQCAGCGRIMSSVERGGAQYPLYHENENTSKPCSGCDKPARPPERKKEHEPQGAQPDGA